MKIDDTKNSNEDEIASRLFPCLVAYMHPFRIIEGKEDKEWNPSIDDINKKKWNYIALHEIVGGIDVGLPSPFHLVIARDGALALPPTENLRSHNRAVDFFNYCLSSLLIGGVYCEAMDPDGLDSGVIIDSKYVRVNTVSTSSPNRFHLNIRLQQASGLEAISLYKPHKIPFKKIYDAISIGIATQEKIDKLQGEYLLRGITELCHRNWGSALANLWIIIEQLISEIWQKKIVSPTKIEDSSKNRQDQLNDTRTWNASARLELLFQTKIISNDVLSNIKNARKARNKLSHEGKNPAEKDVMSALRGLEGLFLIVLNGTKLPIFDIDLSNHQISDIFSQKKPTGDFEFWMPIPKLPGEVEMEKRLHRRERK